MAFKRLQWWVELACEHFALRPCGIARGTLVPWLGQHSSSAASQEAVLDSIKEESSETNERTLGRLGFRTKNTEPSEIQNKEHLLLYIIHNIIDFETHWMIQHLSEWQGASASARAWESDSSCIHSSCIVSQHMYSHLKAIPWLMCLSLYSLVVLARKQSSRHTAKMAAATAQPPKRSIESKLFGHSGDEDEQDPITKYVGPCLMMCMPTNSFGYMKCTSSPREFKCLI